MHVARALLCAALAGACSSGDAPQSARGGRPDVVLIVVDTLRADHADSSLGHAATPALDALAADGVRFENAFAHAPMTLPAHTSLFSSRPPHATGVVNNGQSVPDTLPLLAERLRDAGWRTGAAVGLATMWPAEPGRGLDRGFDVYRTDRALLSRGMDVTRLADEVLDELAGDGPLFLFAHYADPHHPYDAHDGRRREVRLGLDGAALGSATSAPWTWWTHTAALEPGRHRFTLAADEPFRVAALRIRQGDGAPLELAFEEGALQTSLRSLAVAFTVEGSAPSAVHWDVGVHDVPPESEIAARYAGEAAAADRAVGALLDDLRARGLYDDALIVFTSDHGEALGEHGNFGHVRTLYDEMLRVPLIVKLPRGDPRAATLAGVREALVRHVDVAPTLLELLGLDPLAGQVGASLLAHSGALLQLETHAPEAPHTVLALRDERHKLVFTPDTERFELYDLAADPGELEDLFPSRGSEFEEWARALRRLAERPPGVDAVGADVRSNLDALGY